MKGRTLDVVSVTAATTGSTGRALKGVLMNDRRDTAWTPAELERIGRVEEVGIASYRPNGSLRPFITIWGVRVGDEIFIRSAYGVDNPWFRRAVAAGTGRISAEGIERDVRFSDAADADHSAIDAAYRAKYKSHPPRIVATVVGRDAPPTTLQLTPQD